jgi:hypothetical protein
MVEPVAPCIRCSVCIRLSLPHRLLASLAVTADAPCFRLPEPRGPVIPPVNCSKCFRLPLKRLIVCFYSRDRVSTGWRAAPRGFDYK